MAKSLRCETVLEGCLPSRSLPSNSAIDLGSGTFGLLPESKIKN